MKTVNHIRLNYQLLQLIIPAILFCSLAAAYAQVPPPGGGGGTSPTYTPLDSWSFIDSTNWTNDKGYAPTSFARIRSSYLGNGYSLVVDTNVPAWLQFPIQESDGTTNLCLTNGTVTFWFAPGSWSGTNAGGTGPGEYGRLLEVGGYTANSSFGWWSLYTDNGATNLYFSTQTNDLSGSVHTFIATPISWTTNYFHFVALTYSATNTALYLDGVLATNGPGLTVYPNPNAVGNKFYIGSDSNGVYQAHGLFNDLETYNVSLPGSTIAQMFNNDFIFYMMNPLNSAMARISSAGSSPYFTSSSYSAITGAGDLQWVASVTAINGSNADNVWITNVLATASSDGTMNLTFTIQGGLNGYAYDAFVTGYLESPISSGIWSWLGQGYHGNTYTVNIPSTDAFLILGTPQDSNNDGVTDAYSLLVAHINPNVAQSDAYGVPFAWYVQNGLSTQSALLDPDMDGLLNYQEYGYGTRPNVSEGLKVWVGTLNGMTVIP